MSNSRAPRKASAARSTAAEHPLDPDRRRERSSLAEPPLVGFGTRLPADLAKEVKLAAVQRGMSIQEITEAALRQWLAS